MCGCRKKNNASVCKDTRNHTGLSRRVRFTAPARPAKTRCNSFAHSSNRPDRARAICVHVAALQSPDQLLAFTERRAPPTQRAKMFAPQGPEPIVAIKAGKCKVEPHRDEAKRAAGKLWITPQKDRGEVIVVKKDDVNHFQWRSREMPCAVDPNIDTMVFPGDAEFQRTSTGRDEDRVYILQFKAQEDRRFFFWMQDADDSNDKELVEKLNKALNGDGADLGASLRALRNNPAPAPAGQAPLSLDNIQDVFASLDMPAVRSRRPTSVPSRHRRASSPREEAVRTESTDRDAPRRRHRHPLEVWTRTLSQDR